MEAFGVPTALYCLSVPWPREHTMIQLYQGYTNEARSERQRGSTIVGHFIIADEQAQYLRVSRKNTVIQSVNFYTVT